MIDSSVIQDPEPLQPGFLPSRFHGRNRELQRLESSLRGSVPSNLHLYGPLGTGKTHLTKRFLESLPQRIQTCLVPCEVQNTQYKVLKQLCQAVIGETVPDGFHASELKRRFENRSSQVRTVVVLDQVDFLLLNDGDDLLYYLSRIQHSSKLAVITISENLETLEPELGERTYSTLQPEKLVFEPYSAETLYRILEDRTEQAFYSETCQRKALTYIAASTENAAYALQWLKTAAQNTGTEVTEDLVRNIRPETDRAYAEQLLHSFSEHHNHLYNAVVDATDNGERIVHSGTIYERYRESTRKTGLEPLSERRISDFLKHLEILQIVESEYHYGGDHGKTREVKLDRNTAVD